MIINTSLLFSQRRKRKKKLLPFVFANDTSASDFKLQKTKLSYTCFIL